jgi:hypothetical protein
VIVLFINALVFFHIQHSSCILFFPWCFEQETILLKVYDSNSFNAIGLHQMPALTVELDSADCEICFARFRSA